MYKINLHTRLQRRIYSDTLFSKPQIVCILQSISVFNVSVRFSQQSQFLGKQKKCSSKFHAKLLPRMMLKHTSGVFSLKLNKKTFFSLKQMSILCDGMAWKKIKNNMTARNSWEKTLMSSAVCTDITNHMSKRFHCLSKSTLRLICQE